MDSYKLRFKTSAEKELRCISKPHLIRIIQKIEGLSHQPRPHGAQMLKGEGRYYRLRQGDYRIVYEIDEPTKVVMIFLVRHRRDAYQEL